MRLVGCRPAMPANPVVKKLMLKPGQKAAFINAPKRYLSSLGELPEGVTASQTLSGKHDFIQLFVTDLAELKKHAPKVFAAAGPDALVWICYPKGTSKVKTDLNRDILWKQVEGSGFLGVAIVAIDETWSAMRFREEQKVSGKKTRG